MTEFFQDQRREQLEAIRDEESAVVEIIRTNRQHVRHERRHPGRMGKIVEAARYHIGEAEYLLPALAEGPLQKVAWIGFRNSLTLAREYLLRAVIDPAVVLGEETSAIRARGADAVNEHRSRTHTSVIEALAERRDELGDYSPANELWPHLYSMLPNAQETEADKSIEYDGGEVTYEGFRKALLRIRKRRDNA